MRLRNYFIAFMVLGLAMNSCKKDDDNDIITADVKERTEQYSIDLDSIEKFLSTHFYNYEEFEANPNTTDLEIIFTHLDEDPTKTPIMDRPELTSTIVNDGVSDVDYKLYVLRVREGDGEQPKIADSTFIIYNGTDLSNISFDSAPNPTWFDLTRVVPGFKEVLLSFKGATVNSLNINIDGTIRFEDYGIGAVFMPSGLAYYASPPSGIGLYEPLVFRFNLFLVNEADHDMDHIPSYLENLNGDNFFDLENDDTDQDTFVNFIDSDDDGDGILTRNELQNTTYTVDTTMGEEEPIYDPNEYEFYRVEEGGVITIKTATLVDSDNNSVWDYLEASIAIDYSEE